MLAFPAAAPITSTVAAKATPRVPNVKMPLEPVVNLLALGGVVYVATTSNVYRVEGDRLVRLTWPPGPTRGRGERTSGRQRKRKES